MFFQVGYLLIKLLHRLKKVLCCKYSQHVSANVNYLIVENNSELKYVKNSTLISLLPVGTAKLIRVRLGFFFILLFSQPKYETDCSAILTMIPINKQEEN